MRADDGEDLPAATVIEEEIKSDVENHGDAGQRGQRGNHLPGFQLGQHGSGKAGVFAEIDQSNLLAEPELTELLASS